MRILWVVNTVFPGAAARLEIELPVFGGWMYGLAESLAKSGAVQLAVATVYPGKEFHSFAVDGILYFLLPKGRGSEGVKDDWRRIASEFSPDIVHIHGTEYAHGMALMTVCPNLKYVVSIQGLVSVCHRYFLAGISHWDVLRNITFRDIIRRDTIFHARRDFYKRGLVEREYIRRATAIVGRTDWDRAHAYAINPEVPYFFCNESLRNEFYCEEHWSLESCRRHSIFISQASYPIKGLHQLLKAIALLKDEYPNVLVQVAGNDITRAETWKDRIRRSGYGRYIASLIHQLGLERHVSFLGPLKAAEMKQQYLRSHLFVCPSSIENSSNSLGEAQILGVCSVASYCGGLPSMVADSDSAIFYPFEEFEVLAQIIRTCFEDDGKIAKISVAASKQAKKRHDRHRNVSEMLKIYSNIVERRFGQ